MSLKLELYRTYTFFGKSYSFAIGTLVYTPTSTSTDWNTTTVDSNTLWRLTSATGTKYRTLTDWSSYLGSSITINAIELGVGTSTPTGTYTGSIDWIEYSILSSGTLSTETVDFASPIPEPATAAALYASGGLGIAMIARRRKQRR